MSWSKRLMVWSAQLKMSMCLLLARAWCWIYLLLAVKGYIYRINYENNIIACKFWTEGHSSSIICSEPFHLVISHLGKVYKILTNCFYF